ncbi:hypothetical protein C8Q80DRAFT_1274377 [Daedaleopsis nitida]|nr:hypothetical protein C8Q80DRAFT_1274377 [Daedaleopsis nitida]
MSLDQGIFTLDLTQRPDDRSVTDLIDAKGIVHYTKRRLPGNGNEYKIEVYDPLSESLLATVSAPSPTSKHKTLQLYNPDIIVELKYTGTISFRWGFKWEDHEFEWKREECYIVRKPDPAVLIASTKEPAGRLQTRTVQLLYYNINRFDVADLKGLEIVILTALLTFQDLNETYHTPKDGTTPPATSTSTSAPTEPPALPPKPEPRKGIDRVAELHAVRTAQGEGDANEIEVGEECGIEDYARYAERLLTDEAMLFVSIRSASAAQVPKVLRVVEETKRLRHKSGIAEDEELHQYVIYDTEKSTPRKGPKRINLNDPDSKKGKDKYAPPTSLVVHLSKIDMPELRPRAVGSRRPSETGTGWPSASERPPAPLPEMTDKERKKLEKESKKAEKSKDKDKDGKKLEKGKEKEKDSKKKKDKEPNASLAPSSSQSGNHHHPAHQPHPYQPSPSPSQLTNPGIYTSPPPPPPRHTRPRPVSMAFPAPNGYAASFYGSGAGSGYNVMPAPSPYEPQAPLGGPSSLYRPPGQESTRPTSFFQSSSGKGPVSTLLDMWSKH